MKHLFDVNKILHLSIETHCGTPVILTPHRSRFIVTLKSRPAKNKKPKVAPPPLTLFYMGSGRYVNTWGGALSARTVVKL